MASTLDEDRTKTASTRQQSKAVVTKRKLRSGKYVVEITTPDGKWRHKRRFDGSFEANQLAARVFSHVEGGAKINSEHWKKVK